MTIIIKKQENEKKFFSLPIVNKFICCFCMPLDSAVKLCTSLLLFWLYCRPTTIEFFKGKYNTVNFLIVGLYLLNFISLGLFFINSIKKNKNILFMKQCKYIFPSIFIDCIYQIFVKTKCVINKNTCSFINYNEIKKSLDNLNYAGEDNIEMIKIVMEDLMVAVEIFTFIFYVYYYFAMCSYILSIEEMKKEQIQHRNLESATE